MAFGLNQNNDARQGRHGESGTDRGDDVHGGSLVERPDAARSI